jgi:cytochrome d ubiquinol oxidase subunit II
MRCGWSVRAAFWRWHSRASWDWRSRDSIWPFICCCGPFGPGGFDRGARHLDNRLWRDFLFTVSNILIALLPGVAIGNVVRGVPLDGNGDFSLALFTDFGVRGQVGLLDRYTLLIGLFSLAILCAHGATYLTLKTEGGVHDRSFGLSRTLWIALLVTLPVVSLATVYVRPDFFTALITRVSGWLVIAALVAAIALLAAGLRSRR